MKRLGPQRTGLMLTAVGALTALAWVTVVPLTPWLIYNASDSVPKGWYRIGPPDHLRTDDLVLVRLPTRITDFAAQRGYLPAHVPLLKRVAALHPQQVCSKDGAVLVDRVRITAVLHSDKLDRALPGWHGCRSLSQDEIFLLSLSNPASFDSRYFGPIPLSHVIGRAHRITGWAEP